MQLNLSKRPCKTILIDTGQLALRIDFSRGPDGHVAKEIACIEIDSTLSDAAYLDLESSKDLSWIGELLNAKPLPSKHVKILTVAAKTCVFEIPMLNDFGIEDSLGHEVEAIFDIPAADAQLAWVRLPAEKEVLRAWVSVVDLEDVMPLREEVEKHKGCCLEAIAHPCGIRLSTSDAQLELWPDLALFQAKSSDRREINSWLGADAAQYAIESEEVVAAKELGALGILSADSRLNVTGSTAIDFGDSDSRASWADALGRALDPLDSKLAGLPVVRLPEKEMTSKQLGINSAAFAMLALALVILHFFWRTHSYDTLDQRVAELREPVDQFRDLGTEESKLTREIAKLKNDEDLRGGSAVNIDLESQRVRYRKVLAAVADSVSTNAVITEIGRLRHSIILRGVTLVPSGALEVSLTLDESLIDSGWRSKVVNREAQLLQEDGGPWTFEIEIMPSAWNSESGTLVPTKEQT